jgi:hypothetical protein
MQPIRPLIAMSRSLSPRFGLNIFQKFKKLRALSAVFEALLSSRMWCKQLPS